MVLQKFRERGKGMEERSTINEKISKKQLNLHIAIFLLWGYLINLSVALLYGTSFINYSGQLLEREGAWTAASFHSIRTSYLFFAGIFLLVICGMGIHFTARKSVLMILFHISAVIISPTLIEICKIFEYGGVNILGEFNGKQLAVFWLLLMIYVVVIYVLSIKYYDILTKTKYMICLVAFFELLYTIIAYVGTLKIFVPAIAFAISLSYIVFLWAQANQSKKIYTKYYAIVIACKIINIMSVMSNVLGFYNSRNLRER